MAILTFHLLVLFVFDGFVCVLCCGFYLVVYYHV